ncbi:Phospholipid-transporting ATPase [Rhynchospora pubera]|uniref:Phospholipid-transporting ATPase n=1 Tax=Rhynchospora pubera TaxID=906938 RepID=A0AAV8CD69_9POAL|nr:Phospholipid-transporting ATPase [Rhynchospora pubera]
MPEQRRRKPRKIRPSKLYSFACGRSGFNQADQSHLGQPGFSRVVYANEPDSLSFPSNNISTTKYNVFTFIPKSLFEQFRRVANMYFLITACLAYTDLAPYSSTSAVYPLVLVILVTMLKELIEDWRRKQQDNDVNNRKTLVLNADGKFKYSQWKNLRVGDIVKVQKDEFFPADLILLSSNYEDSICYVETMNLDGETNLKLKQSLEKTSFLQEEGDFVEFKAKIRCEDPNADLYTFVGSIEIDEQSHPLSPQQLLLRDSKLRNTDYVYGVVVFTGHDTKVMQNSMSAPSKRSKIERKMDRIIYLLLSLLVLISTVGSVFFGIWTKEDLEDGKMKRWYLRPDDTSILYDPKKAAVSAILHFLTAMMLYGYFIPISLYISIEIVKLLQAQFINRDIQMYHEESDTPAHARTSNLNEELGQVNTILSDKTGTLTCNSMEFIKCSIGGVAYGRGVTEVEKAMAKRRGSPLLIEEREDENGTGINAEGTKIKGFNFTDERIMGGNWIKEENRDIIEKFFHLLAVCHTCIPDVDELSGRVSYEAESPDEAAFVVAAREIGFEFFQRTQATVSLNELDRLSGTIKKRTYDLLNVLEFNSARKRMSVIVRDENGKLLLLSKGADSVMFERLSKEKSDYEEITKVHINTYADAGLRTLVLAYREIDENEYAYFNKKFTDAKNSVSADRDEKIEEAADFIEKNLILLGATAVEDKLQQGVPECIDKLAQAGIKIWVLTGDKLETAINIGYACSLLRQGMKQILITLDSPEIISVEKTGDKEAIAKESKQCVVKQINEGNRLISAIRNESFALIIDGKSLTYALEDDTKQIFLNLAMGCGSVICCRSSPKQKALVTRLVKTGTKKVTLAIGDGANDVGMLQEADIGVGISGAEGMQAVMASDVSIAQFRFLERLLLVHGHWCYRRIASMICYFFYKNIVFGMTLFIYERYASFSGQAAYNDWAMSAYNVFFTSLPVIALGVFDQDVSARFCLKFPMLYQEGPHDDLFRWSRILGWMSNGTVTSVIIFFLLTFSFGPQSFRSDGQPADLAPLGAAMYTCCVWAVNIQMALSISYFTLIQHIFIWGSIALWYIFLLAYGAITPTFSTTYYMVFVQELASAPLFWLAILCVSGAALVPYFSYKAVQTSFFPGLHDYIQWMRHEGRADDPELGQVIRQASARATVGVSARFDARINQQTGRVHHVVQTP